MPLEPDSLVGRTVGPYHATELLGAGGMAWVVAAARGGGPPDVALKVLKPKYARDPQFTARFLNEATIAGELRHPNIIRILDAGQDGEVVYFAMPRLAASLDARLEAAAALPEAEVTRAARDVALGMAFAHEAGIVHRDIKPQNILFDAEGRAVLTDFGIARTIASYVSTTGKQLTIGTPHYISPEQARGLPLDGRTDVYALGVTMYRAATGELPFRAGDWFELARLHVEEPPEPPRKRRPELSRAFEKIVLTCMAKDRDERYASAGDLAADLDGLLSGKRSTTEVAMDAVRKMLGRGEK
ncbi:MAG TPA: serine/threonine-protein kinase [Gemmatimonadales bacterium]|nr:serine/threonine-protein kinase [Gemmatimonadales bacterium]